MTVALCSSARASALEAGRERIDRAFTEHIANEHRLIAPLSASDRRDLERVLTAWLAALESGDT